MEFSTFLNYSQSLRFEDKPDYPFLRKLFRDLFIREKYELDFLYDWTQANRVSPTHTSSVNKLQIELKLNREVNASQLMNQDIGSIFQKGGAGGGKSGPTTAVAEKRSKFVGPPSEKNTTQGGHEAATASPIKKEGDDESSSLKQKQLRKKSDENLIPGQDLSDSEKQKPAKKEPQAGGMNPGIKIPIPPPDGKKGGATLPL